MKKKNIIKEKKDFDRIFKLKNQISSKYTYIYFNDNNYDYCRFGICVSKKIGNAVLRNKLKRRIKDIIDKSELLFDDKDYIIVLKKSALNVKYIDLKEDLINKLKNIIDRRK